LIPLQQALSAYSWWSRNRRKIDKTKRSHFDGVVIYFWWHIWKERNRRIFEHKELQPLQVAFLIQESIQQQKMAFTTRMQSVRGAS
jgi:hypothetical protein